MNINSDVNVLSFERNSVTLFVHKLYIFGVIIFFFKSNQKSTAFFILMKNFAGLALAAGAASPVERFS